MHLIFGHLNILNTNIYEGKIDTNTIINSRELQYPTFNNA